MTCLCGCRRAVKPGRRYATPGCGGRAHLKSRPREAIIRAGREGGNAWKVQHRHQVLERVRGLSFEDAVWATWQYAMKLRRSRAYYQRKAAKAA